MTFFKQSTAREIKLPVKYNDIHISDRWIIRERYIVKQHGLCAHCHSDLSIPPPDFIREKQIDWDLFPLNFQVYPQHLHHHHDTGMTVGTVHMLCNAVLWQYHGE